MADKADQAQATEESKKKAEDAQKKKRAQDQYADICTKVQAYAAMTATDGWTIFFSSLQAMKKAHATALLDEEKTREIHRHQDGNKKIEEIFTLLEVAVDELNGFCEANSLFSKLFKYRATFNRSLGTVEMHRVG